MKKLEQHDWWPELLEMKDQFSLRELSEKFGASPAAIANALKRNGISRTSAPAGPRRARKSTATPKRRGRKSKLSQFRDQMGKVVDREIAERAGVTVSAVTNYRRRHNIKASGGQGRPRKRPEGAIAPKLHRVGARGYRVVIANDIAEAAAAARRSGRGEVTQIELLGRALG
jgi:transposase